MFGDGFTHSSPVSSNHWSRVQSFISTTVRSQPIFFSALNSFASSPIVMPWRIGIGNEPTKLSTILLERRTFDLEPVDRVRPIEHEDRDLPLRRLLHHVRHRRLVRVEARADVLDVDDHRVDALQHLVGRAARLAVERVDRQAGLLVLLRRHLVVERAPDPVLGAEERHQRHALGLEQQVDGRRARAGDARVVRHQADALAAQPLEPLGLQDVDAGEHGRRGSRPAPARRQTRRNRRRSGAPGAALPAGAGSSTAEATTVATFARSGVTSPLPSGARGSTGTPRTSA